VVLRRPVRKTGLQSFSMLLVGIILAAAFSISARWGVR
jgi:hypothetical protein